jgi:hypothetical protein
MPAFDMMSAPDCSDGVDLDTARGLVRFSQVWAQACFQTSLGTNSVEL